MATPPNGGGLIRSLTLVVEFKPPQNKGNTMASVEKRMDHIEYPATMKTKTVAQLRYIIQDCREVIALQSDFNPNIGYYEDEIHYASMELRRRGIRRVFNRKPNR